MFNDDIFDRPLKQRPVAEGTRFFECEECGHEWEEYCRDYLSPSGEHCPECGDFTPPCNQERKA